MSVQERVLITGGSGFIGTNLIDYLLDQGSDVCSVDIVEPQKKSHQKYFHHIDLLNKENLKEIFLSFSPTAVIHLAARTDITEHRDIHHYDVNTIGTENIIEAANATKTVQRVIFTSTKLVHRNGYYPTSPEDYSPETLYGESKKIGEQAVRACDLRGSEWCIVRPGSIWGPWFKAPYRGFFERIIAGKYYHIRSADTPKVFGYVGNTVFQLHALLTAPPQDFHKKTYYLSDYQPFVISEWATIIQKLAHSPTIKTLPEGLINLAAKVGDGMRFFGYSNPPLSSFRLQNMRTETGGMPLEKLKTITGELPYSLKEGCSETLAWLAKKDYDAF